MYSYSVKIRTDHNSFFSFVQGIPYGTRITGYRQSARSSSRYSNSTLDNIWPAVNQFFYLCLQTNIAAIRRFTPWQHRQCEIPLKVFWIRKYFFWIRIRGPKLGIRIRFGGHLITVPTRSRSRSHLGHFCNHCVKYCQILSYIENHFK
jgi:hypothetical protein